jgi:hypothetical protein
MPFSIKIYIYIYIKIKFTQKNSHIRYQYLSVYKLQFTLICKFGLILKNTTIIIFQNLFKLLK